MSKKKVKVGNLTLGGEHIYIQSMLNIPADDVEGNVRQAIELEKAGCEIIRTAVPAVRNSELIYALKNGGFLQMISGCASPRSPINSATVVTATRN